MPTEQVRHVRGPVGDQDTGVAARLRVDADHGLAVEVLGDVGGRAVLADDNDDVVGVEQEPVEVGALDAAALPLAYQLLLTAGQLDAGLRAAGLDVHVIDDAPGLVVTRTVAMLVNLAVDALHQGVASGADIDTAMRLGTNYPLGPLEWGQRWEAATVCIVLSALQETYGDPRYRPSQLLRRRAASGEALT